MTNKIYAIVGPHAAGKTMLIKQLISMGLHYIPTYTTRQPGKIDSDTAIYKFVNKLEFFKYDFIIKVTYKGDYYGVLKQDVLGALQKYPISLLILDSNGIKQLAKLLKHNLETIYVMCDYVTLVERMLRMGHTNADIKHHLEYAENNGEFDSWKITSHVIKNVADPHIALNQILSILDLMTLVPKDKFNLLSGVGSDQVHVHQTNI